MATPMEEFLRMNAQWGLPMPGATRPPTAPQSPYMPPQAQGQFPLPLMGEAPMAQMPMTEEEPAEEMAPGGFAPAAFAPPRQMMPPRNADVFGDFTSRLGLRAPTASPQGPLPAQASPPGAPRYVQAQPSQMPQQQMAHPTPRVSPMLAKRFPGSTRTASLVDAARARRGY